MAVTYGFYDSLTGDRKYNALQMSRIFEGIITDGVLQSVGIGMAVTANSGMTVNVGSGRAWFNNTWTLNDTTLILTVDAAEVALNRIDRVIVEVNSDLGVRANAIKMLKGTPASSPVAPTLANSSTLHQYALADIYVGVGVTTINSGNITNKIGTAGTPYVTGIITTLNTAWLYANWQYQFDTWFANLVNQLSGSQVTNLQNQIDAIGSHPPTFKNLIINGDMQVSQRGTSKTGLTSGGYKTLDRWQLSLSVLGTWTNEQNTSNANLALTGNPFSNRLLNTTANAAPGASSSFMLLTNIEGRFLQHLKKGTGNAKQLTVSFWVRANKTGTFIVELMDYVNTRSVSAPITINAINTWEYKTHTFPADTTGALANNEAAALALNIWLGAGVNYTSGSLQVTWGVSTAANRAVGCMNLADTVNNDFHITGVQLEVGAKATDFETLPFDVVMGRCKRYFRKSFSYGVAPATALYTDGTIVGGAATKALSTVGLGLMIALNPAMRGIPSIITYNPVSNNDKWRDTETPQDIQGYVTKICEDSFYISAGTVASGKDHVIHWTADAEI